MAKKQKMAKDLVVKKKTGGEASKAKKKLRKGATVASRGKGKKIPKKKMPEKKVPSRGDSRRKHRGGEWRYTSCWF